MCKKLTRTQVWGRIAPGLEYLPPLLPQGEQRRTRTMETTRVSVEIIPDDLFRKANSRRLELEGYKEAYKEAREAYRREKLEHHQGVIAILKAKEVRKRAKEEFKAAEEVSLSADAEVREEGKRVGLSACMGQSVETIRRQEWGRRMDAGLDATGIETDEERAYLRRLAKDRAEIEGRGKEREEREIGDPPDPLKVLKKSSEAHPNHSKEV